MINLEQQYVDNAQPYPSWRQQQRQPQGSVAPTLTDERISRSRLSLQLPHHLMSDNITKDIAVRSKSVAWRIAGALGRYPQQNSVSSTRVEISLPTRESDISHPFVSCTVDPRYPSSYSEQSSARGVLSGLEGVRVDLMDGIDVSRGGDMEFVRGSIVSYPVICTPSHSFASVSLISSTYQSRSHVLGACSTRRPHVHHLTHDTEAM